MSHSILSATRTVPRLARSVMAVMTICCSIEAISAEHVNVYSSRQLHLIEPQLDQFTEATGIKVNLLTAKSDSLLTRLEREAANSPADLLITVDVGRLHLAKGRGLTQGIASTKLEAAIPAQYRDPDGHWFGLSLRARPVMYARGRVSKGELSTYENLADDRWRGRVCSRSSSNVYNQSLVASMIAANGEAATLEWIEGMVANLAKPPSGGGTQQIESIAAGECDVALVNSYYLGVLSASRDRSQRQAAKRVAIHWPNQEGRGVHVNISGAAVAKHAGNRDNAIRLLEFLLNDDTQMQFSSLNYEYPITGAKIDNRQMRKWGEFEADPIDLNAIGPLLPAAVKLMNRGQWR